MNLFDHRNESFLLFLITFYISDFILCCFIFFYYSYFFFFFCHLKLFAVTTCSQATVALNLLRERKRFFDIVLSDVHMPDMDGFKLLELVGLEMDLPVISE